MRWMNSICLSAILLICAVPTARAVVVIEADNYTDGTVLNGFIAAQDGVMLRAEGAGLASPAVFSRQSTSTSTGSLVFGHTSTTDASWGGSVFEYLRADFVTATNSVSLDFVANDNGDSGAVLEAYDASGNLVDTMSSADLRAVDSWNVGDVATLTVSGSNIQYVLALGDPVSQQSDWNLDQLQVAATPAPAAFTLVLIGLGLSRSIRRRTGSR